MSWEVDDQKRDEEDEAGANIWRRRRRFVNDKVEKEVLSVQFLAEDFVDEKK